MEYLIGDFSKIARISAKTLRYYHEIDLLRPSSIDSENGYRIYSNDCLEKARRINLLKGLNFTLKEIKEIIEKYEEDDDLTFLIEQKLNETKTKIKEYKCIQKALEDILTNQKDVRIDNGDSIAIKNVADMLIASIRVKDKYSSIGFYLGKIAKKHSRYICGEPFTLYYDSEYKEENADMEICFPVKQQSNKSNIGTRVIKGGKVFSAIHKGAYGEVGDSYQLLLEHIYIHNLTTKLPTREIYIKGPGMIFAGNPKRYITEVQMMINE